MSRIFWDTNLFVYLLEDKGELTERVVALRERMVERSDELLTSTLTLGEILEDRQRVPDQQVTVAQEGNPASAGDPRQLGAAGG